jgi:hypothetical protein
MTKKPKLAPTNDFAFLKRFGSDLVKTTAVVKKKHIEK